MDQSFSLKKVKLLGYSLAGLSLTLALLSLILGIWPLVAAMQDRIKTIQIPGTNALEFRTSGLYTGIYVSQDEFLPDGIDRLNEVEYYLTDAQDTELFPLQKVPGNQEMATDGQKQIPLFQFAITTPGKYTLRANYPYDMDGPQFAIYLLNVDLRYTRAELIIGIALTLLFIIAAIVIFIKTRRAIQARS